MSDDLLPYYNRELSYLRKSGEQFAKEHPKIAGRLKLGPESAGDPHVERLIQATAFLNGRIQHRLDDDFPELSDSMLQVLYPQFLTPLPSLSTLQFIADPEATASYAIPRGSEVESEPVEGQTCLFRTTYDTEVWPLEIAEVSLTATPFSAPNAPSARTAVGCLRISIKPMGATKISELEISRLRFHLRGLPQASYPLYELLLNDVAAIAWASSPGDPAPRHLPASAIQPVGFGEDESLLPPCRRTFDGYRLLREFFAFPEKFLYVDLEGLDQDGPLPDDNLELFFYLRRIPRDLDQLITADNLALGCTPIVNLFERRAEPVRMEQLGYEYRIVPDARRPKGMEIFSIDKLSKVDGDGNTRTLRPFYGIDHGPDGDAAPIFWHGVRRPATMTHSSADSGTEVYVQVVDLDFSPQDLPSEVLTAETTCINRDLPAKLPFGADRPRMTLTAGGAISGTKCLTAATKTQRPSLREGARWKLISHLTLNHLSLSEPGGNLESFKEILRLYEGTGGQSNARTIESIVGLECSPRMARIFAGGQPAHCRGLAIKLELDESMLSGSGTFLFASVLERFFGLYATVNSFVELTLTTNMREGAVKRWAPRAGRKALI